MKHLTALFSLFTLVLSLLIVPVQVSAATQIDIPGPLGSERFGQIVTALPNGNIVITDPFYDAPGPISNVGAAYLYNGAGALISTLTGTTANDSVGNFGVTALTNGNYVVRSTNWGATDFGAVTWGDGTSGISGVVSSANSLVGSAASDFVGGGGVTALTNGNYVVNSRNWDATDFGAVTWGSGTSGISGVVSAANSLTGSAANDLVGNNGITALTNGNYVVRSTTWGASDFGAVTWGSGTGGISGVVSSANSLTGSTASDLVGNSGITALTNGNYVVRSRIWGATDFGAVTWGDGTSGISGVVSSANSLTGSTTSDFVGNNGVTALTNGNYVVSSSSWDGAAVNVGAATWGSGTSGISGVVSAANSLVGSIAGDNVGNGVVTALTNGNYVVRSTTWGASDFGAVTWGSGTGGISGVVSSANSLTGSTASDLVGNSGITALSNGNYVVRSTAWGSTDFGAVTWGSGTSGISGVVSSANSLTGSTASDAVGSFGVTALTNGNYVVSSSSWDGAVANVGAATWGSGTSGISGLVSAANSLTGSATGDVVGNGGVTALTNGNYVVSSTNWGAAFFGAATWGSGTSGISGVVSAANSLVGSTANDNVGNGFVTALPNGNYVVSSTAWGSTDFGAVTWGSGTSGISGVVASANSLVGSTANDVVGNNGVTALTNGNYVVLSTGWDGVAIDSGAISYGPGNGGTVGAITVDNSVRGTASGGGGNLNFSFDTANNQLVVGRSLDNIVTLFRLSPTAAEASVSGRVLTANGRGLRNARVTITDGNGNSRNAVTSSFGYYEFTGVAAGESYVVAVTSKLYRYAPRAVSVQDDVTDMDFTPETTERKTR